MRKLAVVALAALPLCACSTVKEAVRGPELAPVGYPSALVPRDQVILASSREPMRRWRMAPRRSCGRS